MKLAKVKHFIADVIEPRKKPGVISIIYNILMSLIVIASCVFVFVDIFTPDDSMWSNIAHRVEIISVIIFACEYVFKLFVSEVLYEGQGWFKSKISYITSFDSFIDIVCIASILLNNIPAEFSALRLLKLVKLTRLVKLKDAVDEIREQSEEEGEHQESEKSKGIRHRIYQIIYKDESGDKLSKIYDIVSITIIILSVITIILDTFTFNPQITQALYISEIVFASFFAVEYVLRVWTADFEYPEVDKDHAKMKYIFSFLAIVDLLSILPVFLTFSQSAHAEFPRAVAVLKIFKIFKIARLLKMSRYLNSIHLFVEAIKKKKKQIFFSMIILAFLIVLCSVILYSFESAANNDQFENGFSGLLYVTTVLTGFGESEMEVVSVGGKAMVIAMMICGACVLGVPLAIISDEFAKMVAKASKQEEKDEEAFKAFCKKLTAEQKMQLIIEHQDMINQPKEESEEDDDDDDD